MIGGSKYLLMQAWLIPIINHILSKLIKAYLTTLDSLLPFLPGISVGIAHVIILLLVLINVPSLPAMMFKISVKKQRTALKKMINNSPSEEHKKLLNKKLEDLDIKELDFQSMQIESSSNLQKAELEEKELN
ncbi:hypothetical protein B5C26_00030 [Photorhabdus luminescens]|uniref:hypothetical protein n=1 Tax=Photorhabdus luminescens TaxID=29488 RepID=UPI000B4D6F6B|nr:hypothetical protein [Photorhabdus luminescens]OWO87205.1 hypothetical protein B5C26_00030 [Photorhabdus luminescens]